MNLSVSAGATLYTKCEMGSDSLCASTPGFCCAYLKVEEAAASPDTAQALAIGVQETAGWPTAEGDEAYFCQAKALLAAADGTWADPTTGATYAAYCAQAKKMIMGSALFVGMLGTASSF